LIIQHLKAPSLKDAKFVPLILIKQELSELLTEGEYSPPVSLEETPTPVGVSSFLIKNYLKTSQKGPTSRKLLNEEPQIICLGE